MSHQDYDFNNKRFLPYSDETSGIGGKSRPTTYGVYDDKNSCIYKLSSASDLEEARKQAIELNENPPIEFNEVKNSISISSPIKWETGATSHAVNDLILFSDNIQELAAARDAVYSHYIKPNKLVNPLKSMKYEFINILLYRAMNQYLNEFPVHDDHKHIEEMTIEQQDEFAQLYVNDFDNWKKENGY